jgi:anti-anti-sigma factor
VGVPFSITESVRDGQVHLAFTGYIDLEVRRPVRARIRRHLTDATVRGIVVDLAEATGIDPTGLGILLACRRQALAVGKTFRVNSVSESVTQMLAPSGVIMLLAGATTTAYLAESIAVDHSDR